jgi:hypothetical protein
LEPFIVFKFLHILSMFVAVAATVTPEVVLHVVASSREPRAIATFAHTAERIGRIVPPFFVGGAIFGLLAAWTGQIDFTEPWLLATYVLFVVAIITGATITDPWVARVRTAAAASPDAPSPELLGAIDDRRSRIASAWLMTTTVVIIGLMVFKPGA